MRLKRIHTAVLVSALVHTALFGTILYVAYNGSANVPGDDGVGETIAVSMITEDGGINSSGKSMEVKRSVPAKTSAQKISSQMTAPSKTATTAASSTDEASAASATNKPKSKAGSSSGKGPSAGLGTGDPRLLRMWKKINRSKYYPLNARRNSLNGNPRVTFKTGEQGQVEYVKLAKSCGIPQLDDAAIETVKRAAPLPYYPKPITLTIRYSMKD